MHCREKGCITINNFSFLSDKYQLLSPLGEGSSSKVYLARHLTLKRDCAIKVTPHSEDNFSSVLEEALLLKSIHHSMIPEIYDIEQDEEFLYLVEEYVPGESLEEFLLSYDSISTEQFEEFCRQLFDFYNYLHNFSDQPILYQDMKPEHIIVCGMTLKIIDFGGIYNTGKSGNNRLMGNESFSSPEYLMGQKPEIFSDIYTLGKIILYLSRHMNCFFSQNFHNILTKATLEKPSDRYSTVDEFWRELNKELNSLRQPHLSTAHHIAIIGSFPGCGATHFAICLTSFLNRMKAQAICIEQNDAHAFAEFLSLYPQLESSDGSIMHKNFRGYPFYGSGIVRSIPEATVYIHDFGSNFHQSNLKSMDRIFLVGSTCPWRLRHVISQAESLNMFQDKLEIICWDGSMKQCKLLAKALKHRIVCFPFCANPFHPEQKELSVFRRLMSKDNF